MKSVWSCKLNLPVQWVYDVLDCVLWVPHRVELYKSIALDAKYEQNPMKTADIEIQALDLAFIYEYIRGINQDLLKGVGNCTCFDTC